jgi:hypothetical protein
MDFEGFNDLLDVVDPPSGEKESHSSDNRLADVLSLFNWLLGKRGAGVVLRGVDVRVLRTHTSFRGSGSANATSIYRRGPCTLRQSIFVRCCSDAHFAVKKSQHHHSLVGAEVLKHAFGHGTRQIAPDDGGSDGASSESTTVQEHDAGGNAVMDADLALVRRKSRKSRRRSQSSNERHRRRSQEETDRDDDEDGSLRAHMPRYLSSDGMNVASGGRSQQKATMRSDPHDEGDHFWKMFQRMAERDETTGAFRLTKQNFIQHMIREFAEQDHWKIEYVFFLYVVSGISP